MENSIKKIIADLLGRDIKEDSGFVSRGLLDSLMVVQLIVQIEKQFNISLPAEALRAENFDSISAITTLVQRYQEAI